MFVFLPLIHSPPDPITKQLVGLIKCKDTRAVSYSTCVEKSVDVSLSSCWMPDIGPACFFLVAHQSFTRATATDFETHWASPLS